MKKRSYRKGNLGTWLLEVVTPVFLLDAKRKVLFFNKGCEEITGWLAEDVIGCVCDFVTEVDESTVESVTGTLSPPAEVLAGKSCSVPAFFSHQEGKPVARLIHFFPLFNTEGLVESILGMISEINQPIQSTPPTMTDQLHAEFASVRLALRQQYRFQKFLGKCNAMQRVMRQVHNACSLHTPLLIQGESGTGKEFIARLLHQEGAANQQAFVPFECQQIPPRELLRTLKRLFETFDDHSPISIVRHPGTIYFADVDCLERDIQQFLIDKKEFFSQQSKPGIRLLAGTTELLYKKQEEENVLPEFFYLITTQKISLPPLRQREGDSKLLAQHFLEQLNRGEEKQITGFDKEVWKQFEQYNWQGNLRELKTVIHEARITCKTSTIQLTDLPFRFQTGRDAQTISPPATSSVLPLDGFLEQHETEAIQHALQIANNNKTIAAELLQIPRAKLYRRMEALGIKTE